MKTKSTETDSGHIAVCSCFATVGEADLYYATKDYLWRAEVWDSSMISQLHRYVRLQYEFLELLKKNPKHYMIDKYSTHLQELEKELCLTPKSMLEYKKNKVLMMAKQQKLGTN